MQEENFEGIEEGIKLFPHFFIAKGSVLLFSRYPESLSKSEAARTPKGNIEGIDSKNQAFNPF